MFVYFFVVMGAGKLTYSSTTVKLKSVFMFDYFPIVMKGIEH